MRRPDRADHSLRRAVLAALLVLAVAAGCRAGERALERTGDRRGQVAVPGKPGAMKTAAAIRSERRAYDGAPPVIPHENFGMDCISCHTPEGLEVPGVGYAPAAPHEGTSGMSAQSRCQQCHVFRATDGTFRENWFAGVAQDLQPGSRLYPGAPPVIPHRIQMRENCLACHTGPAAREEIRCSHPERTRCQQCHVPAVSGAEFDRGRLSAR